MATYKEKVGTSVVNYAGNYPGAVEGELWYDSTNKDFKYNYPNVATAAWATGGDLGTGRASMSNAGNAGDTIGAGGFYPPGRSALAEIYNGVAWSETADLNQVRQLSPMAGS